jgi:hypothetical protein
MTECSPCPCCGYLTFDEKPPGTFFICPVCAWEDDNVQYDDPSYEGGANRVNLRAASANLLLFGARTRNDLARVRAPKHEELRTD